MDAHAERPHSRLAPLAALVVGNVALALGPWFVRLADSGPVSAGFWRLALALPFLWAIAAMFRQPVHLPRRSLTIAVALAALFFAADLAACPDCAAGSKSRPTGPTWKSTPTRSSAPRGSTSTAGTSGSGCPSHIA